MVVGATTLLAILASRRERLPAGARPWGQLAIAAILLNVAPFTLFAYGERHVSSVLAGIWNATVPLFTLRSRSWCWSTSTPALGGWPGWRSPLPGC